MKVQLHLTARLLHHRDAEMRDFTVRNDPPSVVGYTQDKLPANAWKLSATPFESTLGADIDIQVLTSGFTDDVYFDDGGADPNYDFTALAPSIQIQDRDASGKVTGVLTRYYYVADAGWDAAYTDIRPGWVNASGDALGGENAEAVTIPAGVGFWFKDPQTGTQLTFAGQVISDDTAETECSAGQWTIVSNPFPTDFTLNSDKAAWSNLSVAEFDPADPPEGYDFTTVAPSIQVQERNANGDVTGVLLRYYYVQDAGWDAGYTDIRPGWVNASGDALGGENAEAVTIKAGEGFWFRDPAKAAKVTITK